MGLEEIYDKSELIGILKKEILTLQSQLTASQKRERELRGAIAEYIAVDGSNGKYNAMSLYDAKQRLDKALSGGG